MESLLTFAYFLGAGYWIGVASEHRSVWWKTLVLGVFWPVMFLWAILAEVVVGGVKVDRRHIYVRPWTITWSEAVVEKGKELVEQYEGRHICGRIWAFRRRRGPRVPVQE